MQNGQVKSRGEFCRNPSKFAKEWCLAYDEKKRLVPMLTLIAMTMIVMTGCSRHDYKNTGSDTFPEQAEPTVEPQPDWLPVHVEGRFGFIDDAGKLLFMTEFPDYEEDLGVPDWREGFLWVGSNFVDRTGRTLSKVTLGRFDFMMAPAFEDGMAYVSFLEDDKWRYGLVDPAGRIVFGADKYFTIERIRNNRCPVPFGERWGYIETNGVVAIPGRFESARGFEHGLAWVGHDGKWGVIDLNGKFVIPPQYDDVTHGGFQ